MDEVRVTWAVELLTDIGWYRESGELDSEDEAWQEAMSVYIDYEHALTRETFRVVRLENGIPVSHETLLDNLDKER